jgi:hypothetical protein
MRLAALLAALALISPPAGSAGLDQAALESELRSLEREHRSIVHLASLARSHDGRAIHHLELGRGSAPDRASRPALLLVAGTEEHDPVGTAALLGCARRLLEADASGEGLLDRVTVHVVPRLSPDAAATAFATPRWSSARSGRPVDDDHDGLVDEDGPEDLNGDGLISWMRVEDPEGDHVLDPEEPRLLREPDRTEGERPAWRYLTEGIDDDGDERWNEDGVGGVNLNRNFPFGYEWFAADSGAHQVSEESSRALADLLVGHPNIGVVVAYGGADNLAGQPKAGKKADGPPRRWGRKPVTQMAPDDHAWLERLGEGYREAVGLEKALDAVERPGSFADWAYFHRGRLGIAISPWRAEVAAKLKTGDEADESEDAEEEADAGAQSQPAEQATKSEAGAGRKKGEKKEKKSPGADERDFLAWLDEHQPEAFLAWEAIEHPDFPGRRVEVGGHAPGARREPPAALVASLAEAHADWLTDLAGKLPRVAILRAEAKSLGRGVHEIEVVVENAGWLPTVLTHGESTRLVHPTRVELDLDEEAILAGDRSARVGPLNGSGGRETLRWIVHPGSRRSVTVRVISALAGRAEAKIDLKGGR